MTGGCCWGHRVAATFAAAGLVALGANAADQPLVSPVKFTAEQSQAGALSYRDQCAICHGPDLQASIAPALVGSDFMSKWGDGRKTIGDLEYTIKNSMPLTAPRSLDDIAYTNIVAYILARNGYVAGAVALSPSTADVLFNPAALPRERPTLPSAPGEVRQAATALPNDYEIEHPADENWTMYNKGLDGQRFSGLEQITSSNAHNLHVACLFQAGEVGSFQASPVVYAGVLYITTAYNTFAIDASSCKPLWEHRYTPNNSLPVLVSRGASIYKGKLFRTTPSGHLIALDAKNGMLLWDVWVDDIATGSWLSAAPIAYDGRVFIGTAGADWGVNGSVYAFDAASGRQLWSFNDIPTGTEKGAKTWERGAEHGGGATWSTYTLDYLTGNLLVSIGNPSPAFNGAVRPGVNLYTNSVVALDQKTGALRWYVQQIPHDTHDWDTVAAPAIYEHGGRSYLAVSNKGGWVYIYDRVTKRLVSRTAVSRHENDEAPLTEAGIHYCPGLEGGVLWNGTAYSPPQNLLYVNSLDWCGTGRSGEDRFIEGNAYFDGDFTSDPIATARGQTVALDAASGKQVWSRSSLSPMLAAVTPTAGGVVFTGDLNGNFLALDAKSGATRYSFNTGGGIAGAASTYSVKGRQYVAVTSGNSSRTVWNTSGAATVVVFTLNDQ